ncbi:sensor histidine kinase [Actinorugispora endophytica]|uniref:histidine kinase n=1 Tax=Actinorugispora endophytica TaxID=1605990 RepID=A0A4R6VDF4_9ACTN|nr:sensor histidine kinase [Actinorugispora endophytica]TDQ55027.1 signal transduction histidine kinase [Actinorugispora endophytica]
MRAWWSGSGGRPVRWRTATADLALWASCTGLLAVEVSGLRAAPVPEVVGMALLLAAGFGVRRALPFTALGLAVGAAVLHSAAVVVGAADTFALAYTLPCGALAFLAGRRSERAAPVVALSAAAALTALLVYTAEWVRVGDPRETLTGLTDWALGVLGLVAVVVAPWLLGRYWRWRTELRTAGWETAERMERAREVEAGRARLRERARIATEMHDSLGHDLALIAVRAAALEMTVDGEAPRSAASDLRTAAHGATLRLRAIIGVLREDTGGPDAGPAAEDAAAVVARAVDAGMSVRLVREGPDPDPGAPPGRAVHRVVQEALTNAARHAPGSRVTVRVVREDGAVTVRVHDTGPGAVGAGAGTAGNGSGLDGLRALVEGAGGTFDAGPERRAAGGFAVFARIPDAADAGAPASAEGEGADGPTETERRRSRIRSGARRRLVTALVLPPGLSALVTAAGFLLLWYVGANTVLPREDYARLDVGDDLASVERVLPVFDYRPDPIPGEPPAPPGSACRYYLVRWENGLPPVYRLCFAEGRLAAKDVVARE